MPLLQSINREEFCLLCGVSSEALGRRASLGHQALALGVERPAEQGAYLTIDAISMELVDRIVALGLVDRTAASMVARAHFETWFRVLHEAEWGALPACYFALGVARRLKDETFAEAKAALRIDEDLAAGLDANALVAPRFEDWFFVASGAPRAIADAVERQAAPPSRGWVTAWVVLSMTAVLGAVQARAIEAGIELQKFTVEERGSPADAALRAEILDYQKRARERLCRSTRRRRPVKRTRAPIFVAG